MTDPTRIHTGAMGAWGQVMEQIGDEVRGFITGGPGASEVQNSHGVIGLPMQNPFDAVHAARNAAVGATHASSAKIADLLRQAAKAYERGDSTAAGQLKAQADRIEASRGQGLGGSSRPGDTVGQNSSMQAASQIVARVQGHTAAGAPASAGAPAAGEKAAAQQRIMSDKRSRELQGLPPLGGGDIHDRKVPTAIGQAGMGFPAAEMPEQEAPST